MRIIIYMNLNILEIPNIELLLIIVVIVVILDLHKLHLQGLLLCSQRSSFPVHKTILLSQI